MFISQAACHRTATTAVRTATCLRRFSRPASGRKLAELVDDPRLADAALRDADYRNEYPELVVPMLQSHGALSAGH